MKFALKSYAPMFGFLLSMAASCCYTDTTFARSAPVTRSSLITNTGQPSTVRIPTKPLIASRPTSTSTEGVINGDQLVTINGIPWAANGWPFSKVLAIQKDSIDSTIVGKVVLDRYGVDEQPEFGIRNPFIAPEPGRGVLITGWGSNDRGCFVEMVLQIATTADKRINPSLIVPTKIEMVINSQRITLNAVNAPGVDRHMSFPYTYSLSERQNNQSVSVKRPGVWTMSRHVFLIDSEQARILSTAPVQNIPIRVTLANRSPVTVPIGRGTVERWANVYGSNSSCASKRTQ